MQAQCFICPECNYDHNHLGVGGINCLKRQLESKDNRIKELEAKAEQAYKVGFVKGYDDFKMTHQIRSNVKPDNFRVELFAKQYSRTK